MEALEILDKFNLKTGITYTSKDFVLLPSSKRFISTIKDLEEPPKPINVKNIIFECERQVFTDKVKIVVSLLEVPNENKLKPIENKIYFIDSDIDINKLSTSDDFENGGYYNFSDFEKFIKAAKPFINKKMYEANLNFLHMQINAMKEQIKQIEEILK